MFTFVAMLAAGAALPAYNLPPAQPATCARECARRYRLSSADDNRDAAKYRALDEDGTDCNVTRSKICRQQPRTLVRASY